MPKKINHLQKANIITIILVFLFTIAYFLFIVFIYGRIELLALETLLKTTISSSISFNESVENDRMQVNAFTDSFEKEYSEIFNGSEQKTLPTDSQIADILAGLSDSSTGASNCLGLSFTDLNGHTVSSDGKISTRPLPACVNTLKCMKSSEFAEIGSAHEKNSDMSYIYAPVVINRKIKGVLTGDFNYREKLNKTFPVEYYSRESLNIILNSDGHIIMDTDTSMLQIRHGENFFDYIKKHGKEYPTAKQSDTDELDARITTVIAGENKYAMAIVKPAPDSDIYIVRIFPSNVLFTRSGNLLAFLVVASLIFFFLLMIVAYRFYKTITKSSESIRKIAYTDALTGFSNFTKFREDAAALLEENQGKKQYYICCIDMVGFRYINDTFGYTVGDRILIEITAKIHSLLEKDEIFARISGDKFCILTERNFSDTDNEPFFNKMISRINTIEPLSEAHIRLEAQMGIYMIRPEDTGLSVNSLYDKCLIALYSIEHRDTAIAIYDSAIHNDEIEKKTIESKMYLALMNGEFRVYVQPKYRTNTGNIAAGEALIRWVDPEKGLVPPAKFIPLFEQNRFVHNIDLYVMEVVCRFLRVRLNEKLPVVPISLNISPVELNMPGFTDAYISIKNKYSIPDGLIELEFTEGIFFENEQFFIEIIDTFHEHGFFCSIDDFGSGYSSLNILKSLPVDVLKLDRLFFIENDDLSRERSIVRSIVSMARALNIKTVAEGVETLETVDFLKLIGCTLIQGYIYSKPLPLTEFEEKLNTEPIDINNSLDLDKFEAVPLDTPISNMMDNSLKRTYLAIFEINLGGNLYHAYFPTGPEKELDGIPERGFYSSLLMDIIPRLVHPDDIERLQEILNPINLGAHFKSNFDLDLEYRQMQHNGSYKWIKIHVIRAEGGKKDSQIYFGYLTDVGTYKETEQKLKAYQNRFSSIYSNFNGVVFECNLETGAVELLEEHAKILTSLDGLTSYEQFFKLISSQLLHPDYKESFANKLPLATVRKFFANPANNHFSIEMYAKKSRKSDEYRYYYVTFFIQENRDKVLISIEDITEQKEKEEYEELKSDVANLAFSNVYESYMHICLTSDSFTFISYLGSDCSSPDITEGRYSQYFKTVILPSISEHDRDTISEIASLESLDKNFDDIHLRPLKFIHQGLNDNDENAWHETLLIAIPASATGKRHIFFFNKNIDEQRLVEKNLNEYAYRLSYALALFDFAYSVDLETERVKVFGGLCFTGDFLNKKELSYSELTLYVKNTEIHVDERSKFRRFTYLESLLSYFETNPPSVSKYFAAHDSPEQVVCVNIVYGAREKKLTFFINRLSRLDLTEPEKGSESQVPPPPDFPSLTVRKP